MSWESRADRVDHESHEHVWQQIADDLRADIESGELSAGSRLPSGPELGEIYGVARLTAIKAVNALRDEGLLKVLSGKGTFVTPKKS
jgi:GntR family transcriptional regulator